MHDRLWSATGVARFDNPSVILDRILTHFGEFGEVTRGRNCGRIDKMIGNTAFSCSGQCLQIRTECSGKAGLFTLKNVIAEHLFLFADGQPLSLEWHDSNTHAAIPDFSEAVVKKSIFLTPRMRRVTLSTPDAARYCEGGFHLRLLIPPKDRNPVWPQPRGDGRIAWPEGPDALTVRIYTIRQVHVQTREIEIDIALHDGHQTPGATWSLEALPGTRVGILGPGGGGMPDAKRLLLFGDETALPAIARIMSQASENMDIQAYIEVEDHKEEQTLLSLACCRLHWLHRCGRKPGKAGLLEAALRQLSRNDLEDTFVWAACGQQESRTIRYYLRNELHLDRNSHTVAAYWNN